MKNTSLLEGDSRRHILRLSMPLLIGNVLQQLYNTIDSLIIGKFLGTDAFSAVGIAGTVMNLFIFVLAGFCVGITILFGQMYGRNDAGSFRREVFVSGTLGTIITVVLSGAFMLLMHPALRLINSPENLIPYIESYLTVIIIGMVATFLYNLFSAILRGIGDTRASTFFLFVGIVVNAVLDYLFVGPMQLGVAGAAWATVISQVVSAVLSLVYILKRDHDLMCTRSDFKYERGMVHDTLVFGFSSALHQSSLYLGKIFVQGAVNLLGTPGIAAYTATMRIEGFANSFGTSYGAAVSVFISQNYGAKRIDRVRRGFRDSMIMGVLLGAAISTALYFAALPGVRIFLAESETQAIAFGVDYLHTIAFVYTMCFTGNTFVGYFRGVSAVYTPLIATTLHITVRAVLSYMLVGSLGLRAIAISTGIGWLVMTAFQISMVIYLKRKKNL